MQSRRLLTDVKNLAGQSLIYGLGSTFLKVIGFILLPLYTHYLTPTDYGVIAVTMAITSVLTILYPLSLHGILPRYYFNIHDETRRRQDIGTIWMGMILAALSMTVLLDSFGSYFFALFFREIPFVPYIRLAIWTAFLNTFNLLPLNLLRVEERPGLYASATIGSSLLTMGLIISLVVFNRMGAYGYLLALFLSPLLLAAPYIIFTLQKVKVTLKWESLKLALVYCLPLVPHSLASWVLDLSDRLILERYVPLGQVGLYALSYQLSMVIDIVAMAINNAWVPFLFKEYANHGDSAKPRLARLATYYTFVLVWIALGLGLLNREFLLLFTAPAFHSAYQVAPWLIGGLLLGGLYYIPVNFLFLKEKTGLVPLVTLSAGLTNIGLNLWLVPLYGIMGAAWATFFAYVVMLILVWTIAMQVYSLHYEYKRLGLLVLIAGVVLMLGFGLQSDLLVMTAVIKGLIWLLYPLILALFGFFTTTEKETALSLIRRVLTRGV